MPGRVGGRAQPQRGRARGGGGGGGGGNESEPFCSPIVETKKVMAMVPLS